MRAAVVAGLLLACSARDALAAPSATGKREGSEARPRVLDRATPARHHARFAPLASAGWTATWDRETGVPAWLWGGRVDAPDPMRAAHALLAEHIEVLAPGAAASDFVALADHVDAVGLRTISFAQTWRGLRVVDGAIAFVFRGTRLVAIRSRAMPDVSAPLPAAMPGRVVVRAPDGRYRIAEVRHDADADVFIDVLGGGEVARTPMIAHGSGKLRYAAGERWGGGTRTTYPAPFAEVRANISSTDTAADGTFYWMGTNPATVTPSVTGTYARVVSAQGAVAASPLPLVNGGEAVWDMLASETDDAAVSTYIYANIAKARARAINPAVTAWLDTRMDFFVNDAGGCNAYATPTEVHLFAGTAQCENTGRAADIVFHEFAHSLHAQSIISGVGDFDEHLSEGLADFFAANITGDPAFARGFYRDNEPLRHIDPAGLERVYPNDFDFDTHLSGLIIAGALWDLRKRLVSELGEAAGIARVEQIFTGIMQRADDISVTYDAARIADDDDGDLANGTPNECALRTAFGRHGLVDGYELVQIAPPAIDGRTIRVGVTPPAVDDCPPPSVAEIRVEWQADHGEPGVLALTSTGAAWSGELPEQPDGTLVTFRVVATLSDGSIESLPKNAADPRYQLYVGEVTPIWCESLDADPQWEETTNAGREWQWDVPLANPLDADPDAPFSGPRVYGTDLTSDGVYRANLTTTLSTPAFDVPHYRTVRLQYRRWLTVEDAAYDTATVLANGTEVWRNASDRSGTLDHVDREWRYHDIDVTEHVADGRLQLAWSLDTDSSKELGGWTIDDICVVGIQPLVTCDDGVVVASYDDCDDAVAGGGCSTQRGGGSLMITCAAALLAWFRRGRSRRECRSKPAGRAGLPRS